MHYLFISSLCVIAFTACSHQVDPRNPTMMDAVFRKDSIRQAQAQQRYAIEEKKQVLKNVSQDLKKTNQKVQISQEKFDKAHRETIKTEAENKQLEADINRLQQKRSELLEQYVYARDQLKFLKSLPLTEDRSVNMNELKMEIARLERENQAVISDLDRIYKNRLAYLERKERGF